MTLFKLHDNDEILKSKGAIEISSLDLSEIEKLNQNGYGIFWVLNDFNGARKKENLTHINFWFCDIDGGNKTSQIEKIKSLNIVPTWVIETKNGYHCYWAVNGKASLENFEKIEKGIIKKLNGDKHCVDPLRLLRAPGYYHMKNPKDPFFVNFVEELNTDATYTEEQMLFYFEDEEKSIYNKIKIHYNNKNEFLKEDKWEQIFKISEIVKGCRNSMLARYTFWLIDEGLNDSDISYIINGINQKTVSPLSQHEINTILRSKGVRA